MLNFVNGLVHLTFEQSIINIRDIKLIITDQTAMMYRFARL
jgi:hypothetical protein